MISSTIEMSVHRANTTRFIAADPTAVVLTPKTGGFVDGTLTNTPAAPRPSQIFKVIWDGGTGVLREIAEATPGARRFDFILLGEYDSTIEIGDTFFNGTQQYVVEYKFPDNGYEVKAGGVSHGPKPTG